MTTLNLAVSGNANDGSWWTTSFNTGFAYLGYANTNTVSFYRFTSVTIPQADTISTAVLTFKANGSQSGSPVSVNFVAVDEDNSATISSRADGLGRAQTSAAAAWNSIASWTNNTEYSSPDIAAVVQEVVDRGGWTSGNAICILCIATVGSGVHRLAYDATSGAFTTKLDIDYTAGGGGTTRRYSLSLTGVG